MSWLDAINRWLRCLPSLARAIVVGGVAGRWVLRVHQRHVAFAALDGFVRVAFVVPMAGRPVVVLVLQLNPAHPVHLLIDKLLVASRAIFRLLKAALGQLVVFIRISADQEIARQFAKPFLLPLPKILVGLGDCVIGVALDVGLPNSMASQAGNALLVSVQPREIIARRYSSSRKKAIWGRDTRRNSGWIQGRFAWP